eukprot:534751-Amphidinium_carterae.2
MDVACKQIADCRTQGVFKTWSNARVFAYWRIAPTSVELAMRRLSWLQSMARNPDVHAQTVAALFGQMAAEDRHTLLEDGGLVPAANPYAHEFFGAVYKLSGISIAADIFESCWPKNASVLSLFHQLEVQTSFVLLDVRAVRNAAAAELTNTTVSYCGRGGVQKEVRHHMQHGPDRGASMLADYLRRKYWVH